MSMTNETILIVDDDEVFARRLQFVLETGGYETLTAASAAAARQATDAAPAAVVLVGLSPDEKSTRSLLHDLADHPSQPECILLAEPVSLPEIVELYDVGNIYNHRWKPLEEIGDLTRDIGRALERRALKRQKAYLLTELRDARDELRNQAEFLIQVEKLAALGHICAAITKDLEPSVNRLVETAQMAGLYEAERIGDGVLRHLSRLRAFVEPQCTQRTPVDLRILIEEALELLLPALTARGIRPAVSLETSDLTADVCAARVKHALSSILLNSLQAMPGGGELTIRAGCGDGPAGGLKLVVEDTGEGIPAEVLPYVFDAFYTTRPLGQGTGLGLSIVRSVVRDHDGEVSIYSVVGGGTSVTITLPAAASFPHSTDLATACVYPATATSEATPTPPLASPR
jgi:signal transduction histidine kinase